MFTTAFSILSKRGNTWVVRARPDLFQLRWFSLVVLMGACAAVTAAVLQTGRQELRPILGVAAVATALLTVLTLLLTRGALDTTVVDAPARGPLTLLQHTVATTRRGLTTQQHCWSLWLDGTRVCMGYSQASMLRLGMQLARLLKVAFVEGRAGTADRR